MVSYRINPAGGGCFFIKLTGKQQGLFRQTEKSKPCKIESVPLFANN
jgi:hypothetical protein